MYHNIPQYITTFSWRPFRPDFVISGLLDFVLGAPQAPRPKALCDPNPHLVWVNTITRLHLNVG